MMRLANEDQALREVAADARNRLAAALAALTEER
jgi:hypothetical protein